MALTWLPGHRRRCRSCCFAFPLQPRSSIHTCLCAVLYPPTPLFLLRHTSTPPQEEPPSDASRLKQVLKDTFTSFNAAIERIYTNQSGWTIPDASLRDAVKRVIKDDLLGPYSAFLRR